MYNVVLAGSLNEGLKFVKQHGLRRTRVITSADGLTSLRINAILELPSFQRKPNRHKIASLLKIRRDKAAPHMYIDDELELKDDPHWGVEQPEPVIDVESTDAVIQPLPSPGSAAAVKAARRAARQKAT